ncbi:homeobox-leucine zipper protein HOX11-like [Senna tora]|uniref:Homeobox-leucine zipper protein HOX11-like n=1 Tax=Senna tora TaxID=362788 RepID=A0A834TD30_9FABA|nr:homeobox-leucine zipper protein HOX11-like [Senna tora]
MELALSLGEAPNKAFSFVEKLTKMPNNELPPALCIPTAFTSINSQHNQQARTSSDPPIQLNLLPLNPHPPIPCLSHASLGGEGVSTEAGARVLDVNRLPAAGEEGEDAAALSSPNSGVCSFQMEFCSVRNRNRREQEAADRGSDDDESGSGRKKLRLSKEQSAFLEDSFKEHTTLNPKQKLALAKQLNLRPRQVEVWFQNRRARTKLKQTEVDCEYLKRCCETLTEENRRLQKELQQLRALKSSQPFYMHLPATTLTMCPSCERVATTNSSSAPNNPSQLQVALSLGNPTTPPNGQAHHAPS